jgi:uncharacterized protein (TIGR00290 family)
MAPQKIKTLVSWSSGKESAWVLHSLRLDPAVQVVGLLTVTRQDTGAATLHDVPEEILQAQASAACLPLWTVPVPVPCPNELYEKAMRRAMDRARAQSIAQVAYGDLWLQDVRRYREQALQPTGLQAVFPLWQRNTRELALEMLDQGLRAIISCVDTTQLDASFVGRPYDRQLLEQLPAHVDPCAERGEFHTLVIAGPMMRSALSVEVQGHTRDDRFARVLLRLTGPSSARAS